MKILVPCKRVIDYAVRVRVKPDQTGVQTQGVKHSINPFDEIALEESLRIKAKNNAQVVAISIGPSQCASETLKSALAIGADSAIHVDSGDQENLLEPKSIALILQKIIVKDKFDLCILGKQAIDDDYGQTGQILAGLLDWPQICAASKVDIDSGFMESEADFGTRVTKATLPMIITCDLRLNTPRYATLQNIIKAKKKEILKMRIEDLGINDINMKNSIKVVKTCEPPKRGSGVILENVDELVSKIKSVL